MPPDKLRGDELTPSGGAEITFLPTPTDGRVTSVQEAINQDRRGAYQGHLQAKPIQTQDSPEATPVLAIAFDQDPGNGEPFLHYSKIYMKYRGRVAAITLMYRKGDKKAASYERDLLSVFRSFGPLTGPTALDGGCRTAR